MAGRLTVEVHGPSEHLGSHTLSLRRAHDCIDDALLRLVASRTYTRNHPSQVADGVVRVDECHASFLDTLRLARARCSRFQHGAKHL